MRLAFVFAFRYVFSKKKTNAINIISVITILAFAVGSAAMIIVLSALNGFESTLTSLFTSFDPDLKIEAVQGKTFKLDNTKQQKLLKIKGVNEIASVVEDNAVLKYGKSQEIAVIKGVGTNYNRVTQIDCTMVEGQFMLGDNEIAGGVFGYDLAGKLGLNLNNPVGFVTVYVPKKGELNSLNPEQNLQIERILPTGKFFVQEEIDSRYVIVSLPFARALFEYKNEISALELSLKRDADIASIKKAISTIIGKNFTIKDQFEQKESIYKIFRSEKLATFSILSFILLIAAFNMAGALTMLIIEKEKDLSILRSIGMHDKDLKRIFLFSGIIISVIGSITGLLLGGITCWLQQYYGFLKIENSVVEAYPVAIKTIDFVTIPIISLLIGITTAWIPSRKV